jgi:hypothetical protein
LRRGMPMRDLSMVAVAALATVAASLSPVQTLRAVRFRGLAKSAVNGAAAPTKLRVGQTYVRELGELHSGGRVGQSRRPPVRTRIVRRIA